jgi:hypothetical protein
MRDEAAAARGRVRACLAKKSGERLRADAPDHRKDARRRAIEEMIKAKVEECTGILDEITKDLSEKSGPPDTLANGRAITIASILTSYEQRCIRSERNPVHV